MPALLPVTMQPESADAVPALLLAVEQPSGQSTLGSLLPFVLLAIAFWFLLIRPQRKRTQEAAKVRASLQVGAQVMTSSGLYGTVALVEDQSVLLEVAPGVTNRYDKRAIATVLDTPGTGLDDDDEVLDSEPSLREDLPGDDASGRPGSTTEGPDGPPAPRAS